MRGPVPRKFYLDLSRTPTIAGDRPPRYGRRKASFHRRARACPSRALSPTAHFFVVRGPVPRKFYLDLSRTPTIAGDRPPRYGRRKASFHRRARACPSPCVLLADRIPPVGQDRLILTRSGSGDPELQSRPDAPSPQGDKFMKHPHLISLTRRGTGPRPTKKNGFNERDMAGDRPPPYRPKTATDRHLSELVCTAPRLP